MIPIFVSTFNVTFRLKARIEILEVNGAIASFSFYGVLDHETKPKVYKVRAVRIDCIPEMANLLCCY